MVWLTVNQLPLVFHKIKASVIIYKVYDVLFIVSRKKLNHKSHKDSLERSSRFPFVLLLAFKIKLVI